MIGQTEKRGILLVAFGTSVAGASNAYDSLQKQIQNLFPDVEIRRAYTSNFVRRKLKSKGISILSPASALAGMADDGFTHVAVLSLHVIPGYEYHDLLMIANAFRRVPKGINSISVGGPLLNSHDDYVNVTKAIKDFSSGFLNSGDVLVLMGHGTSHSANICYAGLQEYFRRLDDSILVGTIEAFPSVQDVIIQLKQRKTSRVWLMPFLTIAGDHVINDMAGDKPNSWKTLLESEGFEVMVNRTALAQIVPVVDVWLSKISF